MARRASVRYWPSRNGYCCWFQGKQQILAEGPDDFPDGPTYHAARRKFMELAALANSDVAKDRNTCRVVCEMYLRWIASRRNPLTLKIRQKIYIPFTDALGEVEVCDLTHHMVVVRPDATVAKAPWHRAPDSVDGRQRAERLHEFASGI